MSFLVNLQVGRLGSPCMVVAMALVAKWPKMAPVPVMSEPSGAPFQALHGEIALVTGATLVVTGALLVVTMFAIRIKVN